MSIPKPLPGYRYCTSCERILLEVRFEEYGRGFRRQWDGAKGSPTPRGVRR
jgi:hypothetical protein